MIEPVDTLRVEMHGKVVGRLTFTKEYVCAFEYDGDWIDEGFSISPFYLPLKSGVFIAKQDPFDGLFGVFRDSMPDGWGNLLLDSMLREKGVDPNKLTPVTRLSIIGCTGMGALEFFPETPVRLGEKSLSLDELAEEAAKILNNHESDAIEELFQYGGSSGGARPKVLMDIGDDHWIVKFKSSHDPENVGEIEFHCSQIAKSLGIQMPETKLFSGRYFGVKRFDREGPNIFHMISAAGLLHASHRYPSADYKDLLQATIVLTRDIREVVKLFRQMVFNVIVGNKDDHTKNFSFLYDSGRWYLSPAYDLLPSAGFNGQHTTTINGHGNPSDQDMLEAGGSVGLKRKIMQSIIDEVRDGVIQSDIKKM